MKIRLLPIALIVSLGVNAALGGLFLASLRAPAGREADRAERRAPAAAGWRESVLAKRLELNPSQVEALEDLNRTLDRTLSQTRDRLHEKRREAIGMLKEPALDETRLNAVFREIADLQTGIEQAYAMNFVRVKGILTPDQERQYFELLEGRFFYRKNGHSRDAQR
jgi:Spy/CpxP family protein refolding chaperone